jgi:Xaa-Pro dipeptidase
MNLSYTDKNPALGALYSNHLQTIAGRHDYALEKAGGSHAVIYSGNPKLAFLDDYHHPFKANPHFIGWAPLTELPFSYIVYTPGEKPILIYYQPRDYWHVVPGEPGGYWADHFDVRIVHSTDEVAAHLPEDRDKCIAIGEFDDDAFAFGIDRTNPTPAIDILHYARGVKTKYELAVMRLAADRAVAGQRPRSEAACPNSIFIGLIARP